MDKSPLSQLLSNQSMILSYFQEKLEILNFIRWGYDNDFPILMNNRFLHSASHVYYRSLIIEICTLFDDHKHQSNNFHLLIKTDKKFYQELRPEAVDSIKRMLFKSESYFTDEIRNLRNEEVSHYRFKAGTRISLNHKHLNELNCLNKIGLEIVSLASSGFLDESMVVEHKIGLPGDDLHSLQTLLTKLSGVEYEAIWNIEKASFISCR